MEILFLLGLVLSEIIEFQLLLMVGILLLILIL